MELRGQRRHSFEYRKYPPRLDAVYTLALKYICRRELRLFVAGGYVWGTARVGSLTRKKIPNFIKLGRWIRFGPCGGEEVDFVFVLTVSKP